MKEWYETWAVRCGQLSALLQLACVVRLPLHSADDTTEDILDTLFRSLAESLSRALRRLLPELHVRFVIILSNIAVLFERVKSNPADYLQKLQKRISFSCIIKATSSAAMCRCQHVREIWLASLRTF